jgi:hypothetical protein
VGRGEVYAAAAVEQRHEADILHQLHALLLLVELHAVVVTVGRQYGARVEVALLGVERRDPLPHRHLRRAMQP